MKDNQNSERTYLAGALALSLALGLLFTSCGGAVRPKASTPGSAPEPVVAPGGEAALTVSDLDFRVVAGQVDLYTDETSRIINETPLPHVKFNASADGLSLRTSDVIDLLTAPDKGPGTSQLYFLWNNTLNGTAISRGTYSLGTKNLLNQVASRTEPSEISSEPGSGRFFIPLEKLFPKGLVDGDGDGRDTQFLYLNFYLKDGRKLEFRVEYRVRGAAAAPAFLSARGSFPSVNGPSSSFQAWSANLILGIGVWDLTCWHALNTPAGSSSVTLNYLSGFYAADGANDATPPAPLPISSVTGQTLYQTAFGDFNPNPDDSAMGNRIFPQLKLRLTVTSGTQAVYCVPSVSYTAASTSSGYSYIEARRVF